MAKKKYTLYLPVPLARKLDQVARDRHGAKSALVEEALRASLEPQQRTSLEDGLARRLDQISRKLAAVARDQTVAARPRRGNAQAAGTGQDARPSDRPT